MKLIKKAKRFFTDETYHFLVLEALGKYDKADDKVYLEKKYRAMMGKPLDLANPKTFNEKLQWLKLYDHRPEYTAMVDKYEAKKYVAGKIGEGYIIPTLGVWERFDDIDFDKLPNQFVLKCTHDCGGLIICKDKETLDKKAAKKKIEKSLKRNYFLRGREWPYKDVKPRIIAEQYMIDTEVEELRDYKFLCFDGKVDCVMVCIERSSGTPKFYYFDEAWNLQRINIRGKNAPDNFTISKPSNIDEMFRIAAELSKGLPFVRVDLYSVSGKTYFGEMTFFPDSGYDVNILEETDVYWGELLELPSKNTLR